MEKQIKKEIGARLRAKREEAGYTREKLGELCSLSPRFIANVEFGESAFSLETLMSVCRVLACSCDFLLFGEEEPKKIWHTLCSGIEKLDVRYYYAAEKMIQGFTEAIEIASRSS